MMREYNNLSLAGITICDEPVSKISKTFGDNPKIDYDISDNTLQDMIRSVSILAKSWFGIGADYWVSVKITMINENCINVNISLKEFCHWNLRPKTSASNLVTVPMVEDTNVYKTRT